MNFAILILTILGIVSDLIELTYELGAFTRKRLLPLAVMVYVVIEKMSIFTYSQTHRTLLLLRGIKKGDFMNGWKNYETWNASLWIQNDEGLYEIARDIMRRAPRYPYQEFIACMESLGSQSTPDSVRWMDGLIDEDEMNEMMMEL